MNPRPLLRLEGLVAFLAAAAGYYLLGGPLWLVVLLALAPDLSMVGYRAGPRVGAWTYNIFHTYTLPVILGAVGALLDVQFAVLVALVWVAHIGADRTLGFGLKSGPGFRETHLSDRPASQPSDAPAATHD